MTKDKPKITRRITLERIGTDPWLTAYIDTYRDGKYIKSEAIIKHFEWLKK